MQESRTQDMDKVNDALSNLLHAVDHAKAHPSAAADTILSTAVRRALRVGVELYVVDRIAGFTAPIEYEVTA